MPTYIYSCYACGLEKEVIHSMTADVRISCDNCTIQMPRKPAVAAIKFKGKGWGKD